MPESVTDRCTKAHEYLFLLSKAPRYHYDAEAIAEDRTSDEDANGFRGGGCYVAGRSTTARWARKTTGNRRRGAAATHPVREQRSAGLDAVRRGEGRNKRSVWTVATKPFPEAHFATYPPELIEPCILAGCPPGGGTVLDPFGGAGTTGMVADRLQRNAVLIELNPGLRRDASAACTATPACSRNKCDNRYGINTDQALHYACKALWLVIAWTLA
jgi:hypothetical protein